MPAIITNAFRTYNADNFIGSFATNKVYLMIGKADSWSGASAGQYSESSPSDTAIPTPKDTTVAPYIHHNDMIAAKLINASDVSHVVKRTDWTSGTVYTEYDHNQDDQIDQTFFVMTDQYNVYKCISNYGGVVSTVKPTGQSSSIIETSDNYRWKFMYEVQQADVLKYVTTDWIPIKYLTTNDGTAQWTVQQAGIDGATEVARNAKMDRAFAIAPTASCSYRYTDRAGYTTAPELAPPIGRTVDRDSSTFGVETFDYGDVEVADSVGWDSYKRVVDGIMEMINRTGLAHGYSFNSWSDVVTYNDDFIEAWLDSPQTSLYYSLQVMQNTQAKDDALAALDGDFGTMFGFNDGDDDEDGIINMFNDPAACVGCAE